MGINNPTVGGGASAAYKVYSALISQAGVAAPTVVVLQNTLSAPIVWTRSAAGNYVGTLAGAFTSNKTWLIIQSATNQPGGDDAQQANIFQIDNNSIGIFTYDINVTGGGINAVDAALNGTAIEIRVYT